jgi:hypothetical protein
MNRTAETWGLFVAGGLTGWSAVGPVVPAILAALIIAVMAGYYAMGDVVE